MLRMCLIKIYLKYLLLFAIIFTSTLYAEDNVNFNFGKNIDEDLVSKADTNINGIRSNLPELNFNKELNQEIIRKINSNNKINSIPSLSDKKINDNSNNDTSSNFINLFKKFTNKKDELNWYNNDINANDIQEKLIRKTYQSVQQVLIYQKEMARLKWEKKSIKQNVFHAMEQRARLKS